MKILVAVAMAACLSARAESAAFDASSYSRDGLVFQLDGIENVGFGTHDEAATAWVDLVNGTNIALSAGDTVGAKFMQLVTTKTFKGLVDASDATKTFTVEVCLRGTVLSTYNAGGQVTCRVNGRCDLGFYSKPGVAGVSSYASCARDDKFSSTPYGYGVDNGVLRHLALTNAQTFAAVAGIGSVAAYFNGESRTHGTTSLINGSAAANGTGAVGNPVFKPEYYSLRIYNRALSAAELARHARIDRIRFFGADEGMRRGADGGDEYRVRVTAPDGTQTDTWYASNATASVSYEPKSGETFRFWKPAPAGVDRTQTNFSFAVTEPFSTVARLVSPAGRLTAASYVQDGLVLQFDAIANMGVDADGDEVHDGKSCYWKDLSGQGQDAYTMNNDDKLQWQDDACDQTAFGYMQGGYFAFPIADAFYAAQNSRSASTAQLCGRKRREGTEKCYSHIVGSNGGWGYFMYDLANGMNYFASGASFGVGNAAASTNMTLTTLFTTAGAATGNAFLRVWYGDSNYSQTTVSTSGMKDLTLQTGYVFSPGYYDQGFILRAARFYNRVLTDYERLLNTRIDEERFYGSNATCIVSVESSSDTYGTPVGFAYGASRVLPDTAVTCSFTDSLQLYEDGIRALSIADGERTGLLGYTLRKRLAAADTVVAGASEFSGTADDDLRLIWNWSHQYRMTFASSAGGAITCDKASGSWFDDGSCVTLTAVADGDHAFAGWAGETVGIDDLTATQITVPIDRVRTLTAVFEEKQHDPVSLSWQGGAEGRWSDSSNWGGVLPQTGDTVTIDGDGAIVVTLDMATPELASLTVNKTLTVAGWANQIRATSVSVGNGGTLTCAGGFESDGDVSNRVWIVCRDLAVDAGGAIDVTGKGWSASAGVYGAGPGAGASSGCGGCYGGFAGSGYIAYTACALMSSPYGDAADPRDPGSAGSANVLGGSSYCGGAGGGAVLIQASGAVTLNGQIAANGTGGSGQWSGGGSGGGVSIRCKTIAGSGSVSANGGRGTDGHGGHGSGGRIAVCYDTVEQAKLARPSLTLSAGSLAGILPYESNHVNGEIGTVWLSDAALLVPENFNVTGQVLVDATQLSFATLVLDSRWVSFPQDGLQLTVSGDVELKGTSILELGGALLVHRASGCTGSRFSGFRRFGGDSPISVTVGGNMAIGGSGSEVVVRGARMTAADADPADGRPAGGLLQVAGTLSVASSCRIVTVSHYATGASPRLACKNFELASGATVMASGQGYYASNPVASLPLEGQNGYYGFGPGATTKNGYGYNGPGGSHFGLGSKEGATISSDYLYDTAEKPHMAGSGCSCTFNCGCDGAGGGVVFLEVEGNCRLFGQILANGTAQGTGHAAACAGGAVYVSALRLLVDPAAVIQAKGGSGAGSGGCGGGGGVALWRTYDMNGSVLTPETSAADLIAAGVVSAAKGTGGNVATGTDGSVYLGLRRPGFVFRIR